MKDNKIKPKFKVEISVEECKGCGKCITACPKKILQLGEKINSYGFRYAIAIEDDCVGCGNCFYVCPEPGTITIYQIETHESSTPPDDANSKDTELKKCSRQQKTKK